MAAQFVVSVLIGASLLAIGAQGQSSGLGRCGQQQNVSIRLSPSNTLNNWTYTFYCPSGYSCVDQKCQNLSGAVVNSVVDRCNTGRSENWNGSYVPVGACERRTNLNTYCGFTMTLPGDSFTYYFNCPNSWQTCTNARCLDYTTPATAVVTRCNRANLSVSQGKCQGSCAGVNCSNVSV